MRYLEEVEYDEVVEQWALREHKTREQLLHDRAPLINVLPTDTKWYKVRICKNNMRFLQVLNEPASWNILSCWKGMLNIIVKNHTTFLQKPPSLPNVPIDPTTSWPVYFARRLDNLRTFREQAGSPEHNLTLVILASSKEGPFTILEGNHTAVALYWRHFVDNPEIRFQSFISYVGISDLMPSCRWYHANPY